MRLYAPWVIAMDNRNARRLLGLPFWISNRVWLSPGKRPFDKYPVVAKVSKGARKRLKLYDHK